MITFLIYALLAGIGIGILSGPIGSVILWRRISYFGDTLAHATLLGLVCSIFLKINYYLSLTIIAIIIAGGLNIFAKLKIANDATLSILAHVTLALGLTLAALLPNQQFNFLEYLFGDILAVTKTDLMLIFSFDIIALSIIYKFWNSLVAIIIHEELCQVEKKPILITKWAFSIILALVFVLAMKIIGALLITALLIIPAATARQIAKSPEEMAIFASIISVIAVIIGITSSFYYNLPTGPAIVISSFILFAIIAGIKKLKII